VPELPPTSHGSARACRECGAAQDEQQEICVECGEAASPLERGRIRRALPSLSLAALAVLLAASAAYGLTAGRAGNVRDLGLAKPPPPPAVASAAPAPTSTTPAPSPSATPAPPPDKPAPKPAEKPAPKRASGGTAAAPSAGSSSPTPSGGSSSPGSTPRHHGSAPASHPHRQHHASGPAWLAGADSPYSAFVYDPGGSGAGEHGSAAPRAIDGRPRTAWSTGDHPGGLGKPGVGLVVEAGGYQGYSGLGLQTATPGFAASVYSSDESNPPTGDPNSSAWRLEGSKRSVAKAQRIALKGATAQPRYLLVWITKLPARKPRAGLSEISLLP
jgi:hypothetical protein